MKLKIRLFKLTLTFIISMLVVGLVVFLTFFDNFIKLPWGQLPYILIAIWIVGAIIFYIISIKSNYYILHKKYLTVKKYNKELVYNFSEIIYIDEAYSRKHQVIAFVTNKKHVRYITYDKEGILIDVMLDKCHNLLDEETFKKLHPEIKI